MRKGVLLETNIEVWRAIDLKLVALAKIDEEVRG
jgi:hypothetical protein